jgi:glycosyltransferase involved in cell wall biosynthesis
VTFTGRVPPSDITRYYADADIYVQTPTIDNMPLSVLEAFASGLPVVATRVGGIPAILTHGVHGLLAPADDDEAVAGHVTTLLESPAYARQLAAAARETCTKYEWRVAREGWLAAYRSVMNRRRGADLKVRPDTSPGPYTPDVLHTSVVYRGGPSGPPPSQTA